ncbi:MAG: flgE [Rhodocyclaceae bacterium]|nr:flgE [Rhodocyclaceae bacterium]
MSFDIALSGLNAINDELDTISNNIANAGTYGFKSSRANFASMYAGTQPIGVEVGSQTQSINQGGSVLSTGRGMDAAIQGRGFFTTKDNSGALLYTRVGIFSADPDGYVVDSQGRRAQGYAAVATGSALGAMGDLQVPTGQVPAKASDSLTYVGNLSADWPVPAAPFSTANPQSFNSSMVSVVYDSLGVQHSMTQYFVKTGTNQVTAHYTFDGAALGATTPLNFNTSGQLVAPVAPVALALGTPTGAAPLTVNVNYTNTTQFAGEATTTVNNANGYASGILTGVQLEKDGSVMAQYSNGQKQSVGALALATFPNEGGLSPVSDTSWTPSKSSGSPVYFTPGSGTTDELTVGSLEQSNVDVASQLVGLMSSQRNYQANTKVISTENQMMQSLMQAV